MTPIAPSSRSLPASADELRAIAVALARREGCTVEPPDADPPPREGSPPEARVVVSGGGLPGRCLLRVRERRPGVASRDVDVRRAAASEHVLGVVREVPLLRIRGREVDAVLLEHAGGGGVDVVLARATGVRSGEAATLILGAAAGVEALHRAGWAAPDLDNASVVLADDGRPALDGLDRIRPLDAETAVADAEAFHAWARRLCLRVTDGSGMRLLAAVEAGLRQGRWSAVEAAVLAVASPEPVRRSSRGVAGTEVAVTAGTGSGAPRGVVGALPAGRQIPRREHGSGLTKTAAAAMTALDGEPVRVLTRWLGSWARRRPALVASALVPVALAVAVIVLVPSTSAGSASAAGSPASVHSTASASASRWPATSSPTAQPSTTALSSPEPTARPSATAVSSPEPTAAVTTARLDAEDPVVAAQAILDRRHACFAGGTGRECLEAVVEAGAALLEHELTALEAGRTAAASARDYAGARVELVERWGDAALVGVAPDRALTPKSEPASLLLVRGEAGWRLRAVFP